MSNGKKSFVGGAAILAAAGLIGKVIGMFYRVWLTGLITSEGMGLYGTPYSVYNFLLVVSSAGLPTAISKLVSERLVEGDRAGARQILKKTRRILLCTGLICTAIMASLAEPIATLMGDPWPRRALWPWRPRSSSSACSRATAAISRARRT